MAERLELLEVVAEASFRNLRLRGDVLVDPGARRQRKEDRIVAVDFAQLLAQQEVRLSKEGGVFVQHRQLDVLFE